MNIENNFNFLNISIINEKSFYKDKFGSLNNLIKCIALCDIIKKNDIKSIRFNIPDYGVLLFLKKFCKKNTVKLKVDTKVYLVCFLQQITNKINFIIGLTKFLKFLILRVNLPKPEHLDFKNKNRIFIDYLAYFNKEKFKLGKYDSMYWGNLFQKVRENNNYLHLHIFDPYCKMSKKEIHYGIKKLNANNKEDYFIADSLLNFRIILKIFVNWLIMIMKIPLFKYRIKNTLSGKKDLNFFYIFKDNFVEFSIGFNGLLNLYFFYLFENISKKLKKNQIKRKFYYLCENQGWERSFLHSINKKINKVYPIIYTPIRFWDLRFSTHTFEKKKFLSKITKICVMSKFSKLQLIRNDYPIKKIKIVEALRYESYKKINFKKFEKNKYHKKILIIGDVYEKSNNQLEEYILKLKDSKNLKFTAKPHPNKNFSKKFFNQKNINIKTDSILELAKKNDIAICSNMTAASYDLLYLGIPTYIFLSGDGIDFSPIKNIVDSNYLYDFEDLNKKLKYKKKYNNTMFKKNAFLFDKNYKSWKEIILND